MLSHKLQQLKEAKAHMGTDSCVNQSQTDSFKILIDEAISKQLETTSSNPKEELNNEINTLKEFVSQAINNIHSDRDVLANTVDQLHCKIGDLTKGMETLSTNVDTTILGKDAQITTAISSIREELINRHDTFEQHMGMIIARDLTMITERTMTEMAAQLQRSVHEEVVNLTTTAMKQGFSLFSTRLIDEAKSTINSLSRTASPRMRKIAKTPFLQQIRSRTSTVNIPTRDADTYSALDLKPRSIFYTQPENNEGRLSPARAHNMPQDETTITTHLHDTEHTITGQREMPVSSERFTPEEAINSTNSLSNDSKDYSNE
jgi:hypothetical protein